MADFDWTSLIGPALGVGASLYEGNRAANTGAQALGSQNQGGDAAALALAPYLQQGQRAASLLGSEDITQLPGYQSGLAESQRAIDRAAAARGQFYSGNALKAASQNALDYNARKTSERQNQLMQILGMGQNAANSRGTIRMGQGNATAVSQIAQGNARTSGLTSALDLASKYLTSKDSSGNTGAQALASGLGSLWSGAKSAYDGWSNPSTSFSGGNTVDSLISNGGFNGSGGSDYWAGYQPAKLDEDFSWMDV